MTVCTKQAASLGWSYQGCYIYTITILVRLLVQAKLVYTEACGLQQEVS